MGRLVCTLQLSWMTSKKLPSVYLQKVSVIIVSVWSLAVKYLVPQARDCINEHTIFPFASWFS